MAARHAALTTWDGNPATLLEGARRMVGLSPTDPDMTRLAECVDACVEAVRFWLDGVVAFDDETEPAEIPAGIYSGCLLATVEGYRRKDAVFGISGSFTADGIPVRIAADWLAPVRVLLAPYKGQWGVA